MSPSYVTALFVAVLLIAFWRIVLLAALAFVLAAILMGVGAIREAAVTVTDLPPAAVQHDSGISIARSTVGDSGWVTAGSVHHGN
jgi:hypothetical protein